MSYNPSPPLGQATKANSLPVTMASDQPTISVIVSANSAAPSGTTNVDVVNAIVISGTTQISGTTSLSSNGDFTGLDILNEIIKGELPLHVWQDNNPKTDPSGALLLSDCLGPFRLNASAVGQVFTIDTMGYNSIGISTGTMGATVTGCNDLAGTFASVEALPITNGSPGTTLVAGANYVLQAITRYIRLTVTTLGWATYYLRAQNVIGNVISNNMLEIAGATVSSTTAQLGVNIVNIGGTANAAQGGMVAIGSSAASNGQTLVTQITPATPAINVVKATAGRLFSLNVGNPNTGAVYLKIFNATTATLGTTSANQNYYIPAASNLNIPINDAGIYFSTGIVVAVTGGASLTDNTAITTGCELNLSYI